MVVKTQVLHFGVENRIDTNIGGVGIVAIDDRNLSNLAAEFNK